MPRRRATSDSLPFDSMRLEGSLFVPELLERAATGKATKQEAKDYHIPKGLKLHDEYGRAFRIATALWADFKPQLQRTDLDPAEASQSFVHEILTECLGYTDLKGLDEPIGPDERGFPISAIALGGRLPVVIAPHNLGLDDPDPRFAIHGSGSRRKSAYQLAQEYLNAEADALWAIVTNGRTIRLLRDAETLTRPNYLEFDLQTILSEPEDRYADFSALWRILHVSRCSGGGSPSACIWEAWKSEGHAQGTRVRDGLRLGVQEALLQMGTHFIAHPANQALRDRLHDGTLTKDAYFQQLLRLVYRFLFLFCAEERGLLHPPLPTDEAESAKTLAARQAYARGYALRRLRSRSLRRSALDRHGDLWLSVTAVFRSLATGQEKLALPALGGLFATDQCPDLDTASLPNHALLHAMRELRWFTDPKTKQRSAIDYRNMGPEELGSVYESLLELIPTVDLPARVFGFVGITDDGSTSGNSRKTTGSYYTPDSLVQELIKSALVPVLDQKISDSPADPIEALLSLKVCDPACGSGHFLLAAARRLAEKLAELRAPDGAVRPNDYRYALREVVSHCIYGVDLNPMAVELCKVALWLESVEPGKPLGFLNHHIQCGNSLLGANPRVLAEGLPDDAFKPIPGDDKAFCSNAKKQNKLERKIEGHGELFGRDEQLSPWHMLPAAMHEVEVMDDDTAEALHRKEQRYTDLIQSDSYQTARFLADAWCAAFVWKKCPPADGGFEYAITHEVIRKIEKNPKDCAPWMREEIEILRNKYQFFHWHVAFPEVFPAPSNGERPSNIHTGWNDGFDVILGNPPWERPKPEPAKYFAASRPDIAEAQTSAKRNKLLDALQLESPEVFAVWAEYERFVLGCVHFQTGSGTFPLSAVGKFNLGNTFVERSRQLLGTRGRSGLMNVSGLATDDSGKTLIADLMQSRTLISFYDFENRQGLFPAIHRSYKFSAITVSGSADAGTPAADFVFFAQSVDDLKDVDRHIAFSAEDIQLLNPISRNCPIFRERRQAELVKAIYRKAELRNPPNEVLWDWDAEPTFLFVMSDHSDLFATREELGLTKFELDNITPEFEGDKRLPLYESKMFHQFEHRWCSLDTEGSQQNFENMELADPMHVAVPRYWMRASDTAKKLGELPHDWLIAVREVTNSTNERTTIAATLPKYPVGHNAQVFVFKPSARDAAAFIACLNSMAFDFATRTKVGGSHLSSFILRQLPILPARNFGEPCAWARETNEALRDWLLPRVVELTYTAWDLEPFARDCDWFSPPFVWHEARRFQIRCELDAALFHLYGLSRDDTAYIIDTFPIVRRKDEAAHRAYRTKDTILQIYDALAESIASGVSHETTIDPIPASFQVSHPPRMPEEPRRALVNANDVWLPFIIQFIRQAQSEATLPLLREAWHRFADLSRYQTELSVILPENQLSEWQRSSPISHARQGFHEFVSDLVVSQQLAYHESSQVISFPDDTFDGIASEPWVQTEVALSLQLLAHHPEVEKWLPRAMAKDPVRREVALREFLTAAS